jgi:hypothetical protein
MIEMLIGKIQTPFLTQFLPASLLGAPAANSEMGTNLQRVNVGP